MSLFVDPQSGTNKQRLYTHPATKYGQYKIVLSGITLAALSGDVCSQNVEHNTHTINHFAG